MDKHGMIPRKYQSKGPKSVKENTGDLSGRDLGEFLRSAMDKATRYG